MTIVTSLTLTLTLIGGYSHDYSYEFITEGHLIATQVSERAMITMAVASRCFLGAQVSGPVGSGKTETARDYGRHLGMPVLAINCGQK